MKIHASSILGFTSASAGMILGNFAWKEKFYIETIKQKLLEEEKTILEVNGYDEEWKILARKYRDDGIKNKKNPGFLTNSFWEKYKNKDFSGDKDLIIELKKTCEESLEKPYEKTLYNNVLSWCNFYSFSTVKENENCKFWIWDKQTNSYILEVTDDDLLEQSGLLNFDEPCKQNTETLHLINIHF